MSMVFSAWAESNPVGEVVFVKGVVTAGPQDEPARILGKSMPLYEGDVLTTSARSYAVIKMIDGARITIRPDTVLALEEYVHGHGKETALLRMFQGGVRAVAGLIAKLNPKEGYQLHTPTAVVGVRGTEFDARICNEDCAADAEKIKQGETVTQSPVVGRIARIEGYLAASTPDGTERRLVNGGPVYEGDILETGADSMAMVVFRDNSRVVLLAATRFAVEQYQYTVKKAGNSFFRLFKGGLRVLTGLLARRNPEAFRVAAPTAVVGVRGTGFDLVCKGSCERDTKAALKTEDGLYIHVWEGNIELENKAGISEVALNQTVFLAGPDTKPILLPAIPDFMRLAPEWRPDKLEVDMQNMFGARAVTENPSGLYVSVYDGHVTLKNETGRLDLGRGEAGYVDPLKLEIVRLETLPLFQVNDRLPRPQMFDEQSDSFIKSTEDELGAPQKKEDAECEIR